MLKNGRHFRSQLKLLQGKVLFKNFENSFSNKSWENVKIPKRKERGPTDILKALSATVGTDPTAFEYKFPDDPYFYPISMYMKRKLSLSMESGKNAAKWVVQNHPEFFTHQIANPLIKAYMPEIDTQDESEVTESMLEKAILDFKVSKAIKIFKSLEDKQIDITRDTKQKLLELCCFYNCEDEDEELVDVETMWYKMRDTRVRNVWKKNGFAESLFNSMGSDCPLACAAIIMGRLKYYEIKSAVDLFNSPQSKQMMFPVEVYNVFFSRIGEMSSSTEIRLETIINTLEEMNQKGIKPDLYTLNSILAILSKCVRSRNREQKTMQLAHQLVTDFKNLGVRLSLGSYNFLYKIYFSDRKYLYKFIKKSLDHLLSGCLEVEHPDDFHFFGTAIRVISYLNSVDLANDLNALLNNDNFKFFNCDIERSFYYKSYLELVFKNLPIEEAMVIYRRICPTTYNPQEPVIRAIIQSIADNREFSLIPEIWRDFKSFRISLKLIPTFLSLVTLYEGEEKDEVSTVFYDIANSYYVNAKNEVHLPEPMRENSAIMPFALIACLKYGDEKNASMILNDMKESENFLSKDAALELCKYGLSKKNYSFFMEGVKCQQDDPDILLMVEKNLSKLSDLPKGDLDWLENLVSKKKKQKKADDTAKQAEETDF